MHAAVRPTRPARTVVRLAAAFGVALVLAGSACSADGTDASSSGAGSGGSSTTAATAAAGTSTTTAPPLAAERELPTTKEQAPNLAGYNIYRPVDLDVTGAPLPVIVWANGGCLRYDAAWSFLLDSWAKAGFVVVAITAPADGADPRTAGMTTAAEQAAAIDWAVAQNAAPGSPFEGHLDLDRVVAAGNSCGGVTALNLAAQDDRVASVFVLSGSSALPGSPEEAAAAIMGEIDVPVGYVIGGPEDISTTFATRDHELLPDGVPGYLARRASATHPEVSTDAAILVEVAEISTNWIDFSLTGNPALEATIVDDPCSTCPPGTWTVESKNLDAVAART
jgi:hypothetical protein